MLSSQEYKRYSRHLNLPQFGIEEQVKLKKARVLVVGAGGLGSPVLLYLAAAGVGTLGIIDGDTVALSNLQRQILYTTDQIGQYKIEAAVDRLKNLNTDIDIVCHTEQLSNENAIDIIQQYDIVADGSDNFPTRYLVNDACVLTGRTNVYASLFRFDGQVSVFNYQFDDHSYSANYRDLYPTPPPEGKIPDCAHGGVLGVLAGVVGSMQALEVIKLITGIGEPLINKLLLYEALGTSMRTIKYQKRATTNIIKLIDYHHFCAADNKSVKNMSALKEITVQELKEWQDANKSFQLIDVRESHEFEFANIGGELMPLSTIMSSIDKIKEDIPKVVMCRSGQRSAAAVDALQKAGLDHIYNLKGGILAWSREIDNSIPQY